MTPVLLSSSNPFQAAAGPIVELINMAAGPLLMIVAALGGTVEITSVLNQGTTVTISLPVYHPGQEHLHESI